MVYRQNAPFGKLLDEILYKNTRTVCAEARADKWDHTLYVYYFIVPFRSTWSIALFLGLFIAADFDLRLNFLAECYSWTSSSSLSLHSSLVNFIYSSLHNKYLNIFPQNSQNMYQEDNCTIIKCKKRYRQYKTAFTFRELPTTTLVKAKLVRSVMRHCTLRLLVSAKTL